MSEEKNKFELSEYLRAKEEEEKAKQEEPRDLLNDAYARLYNVQMDLHMAFAAIIACCALVAFYALFSDYSILFIFAIAIIFFGGYFVISWFGVRNTRRSINALLTDQKDTSLDIAEKRTALQSEENTKFEEGTKSSIVKRINLPKEAKPDKLGLLSSLIFRKPLKETDEDLLRKHHKQALRHADIQFWIGLAAAITGFVFIIYMIYSLKTTANAKWYEYVSGSLPGAIITVVSALFFKQAQATRDRGSEFFERLNYQKQVTNSVAIAESIKGSDLQDQVKAKIALLIIGINPSNTGKDTSPKKEPPAEEEES